MAVTIGSIAVTPSTAASPKLLDTITVATTEGTVHREAVFIADPEVAGNRALVSTAGTLSITVGSGGSTANAVGSVALLAGSSANVVGSVTNAAGSSATLMGAVILATGSSGTIGAVQLAAGTSASVVGSVALVAGTTANSIGSVALVAGTSANVIGSVTIAAGSSATMMGGVALSSANAVYLGLGTSATYNFMQSIPFSSGNTARTSVSTTVDIQVIAANANRKALVIANRSTAQTVGIGYSTAILTTALANVDLFLAPSSVLSFGLHGGLPLYLGPMRGINLTSTTVAGSVATIEFT